MELLNICSKHPFLEEIAKEYHKVTFCMVPDNEDFVECMSESSGLKKALGVCVRSILGYTDSEESTANVKKITQRILDLFRPIEK